MLEAFRPSFGRDDFRGQITENWGKQHGLRFTGTMYLVKQNEVPYQYNFVSQYKYDSTNTK